MDRNRIIISVVLALAVLSSMATAQDIFYRKIIDSDTTTAVVFIMGGDTVVVYADSAWIATKWWVLSQGYGEVTLAALTDSLNERADDYLNQAQTATFDSTGIASADTTITKLAVVAHLGQLYLSPILGGAGEVTLAALTDSLNDRANDYQPPGAYATTTALAETVQARADDYVPKAGGTFDGGVTISGRVDVNRTVDGDLAMQIYNGHANGYGLNIRSGSGGNYVQRWAQADNTESAVLYGNGGLWIHGWFTLDNGNAAQFVMSSGNSGYVGSSGTDLLFRGGSGGTRWRNNADNANTMTLSDGGNLAVTGTLTTAGATVLTTTDYSKYDTSGTGTAGNTPTLYPNATRDTIKVRKAGRNIVEITADVADNSGNNTYTDATGLSFPVVSGKTYRFYALIFYTSAATATGALFGVNGPTASVVYVKRTSTLTATTLTTTYASAYDSPAAAGATSLAAGNVATLEGFVKPTANGTLIVRFATEVNASAITILAGSTIEWW